MATVWTAYTNTGRNLHGITAALFVVANKRFKTSRAPSLPVLKSPLTDLTQALVSHQWYGECADMEMKALDCRKLMA
nr:unnamed protein product [Callosobruchus chinensis]